MPPPKRIHHSSKQHSNKRTKGDLHTCANPACGKTFISHASLGQHLHHQPLCASNVGQPSFKRMHIPVANDTEPAPYESDYDNGAFVDNNDDDPAGVSYLEQFTLTAKPYINQRAHNVSDLVEAQLLQILNDANAPHFLFKQILEWAIDAKQRGYDFMPKRTSRSRFINHLEKIYDLNYCRPTITPVLHVEDNLTVNVTSFDFTSQIFSLLTDPDLMSDPSLLDINPDNPFTKYNPPDNQLGCFNSGSWYHNAWNNLCLLPNDWLCPIIFGCDETQVGSSQGRSGVTPLHFTLSIFSEEFRNRPTSWRMLGFVYDLGIHGDALNIQNPDRPKLIKPFEKACRYHHILHAILKSYVQVLQQGGILNVPI